MTTSSNNTITSGGTGAAGSLASSLPSNMNISESDFLQLITAQMQNQNPLQPADPTQFLSQMEGLSEVSSLQNMQTALQSNQITSGASMLGQSVLIPSNTATLSSGGTVAGAIQAPAGASSISVAITDSSGNPVTTLNLTPNASGGLTTFSWNGTTSSGATAPAGQYQLTVGAMVSGTSQAVTPLIASQVQSVTIDPTTQGLDLNTTNGTAPLSSVNSIL